MERVLILDVSPMGISKYFTCDVATLKIWVRSHVFIKSNEDKILSFTNNVRNVAFKEHT